MSQTLTDILEELVYAIKFCKEKDEHYIAQAKSKIEEMFEEWIGSDKEAKYIDSPEAIQYNNESCLKTDGYNQAKQEIRNRVKEGVK